MNSGDNDNFERNGCTMIMMVMSIDVMDDAKCPYWDQVSLNNTNTQHSITILRVSMISGILYLTQMLVEVITVCFHTHI